VAESGTDARHLVGRHGDTDAAAADEDSPLRPPLSQGLSDLLGMIGVVRRFGSGGAEIEGVPAAVAKEPENPPFQLETSVIRGYGDTHSPLSLLFPREKARGRIL
jgi:hypothetical protein